MGRLSVRMIDNPRLVKHLSRVFGQLYHFVVFLGRQILEIIVLRVHYIAAEVYFIMQVRAGRFAGVAHQGYDIAPLHFLPYAYE